MSNEPCVDVKETLFLPFAELERGLRIGFFSPFLDLVCKQILYLTINGRKDRFGLRFVRPDKSITLVRFDVNWSTLTLLHLWSHCFWQVNMSVSLFFCMSRIKL